MHSRSMGLSAQNRSAVGPAGVLRAPRVPRGSHAGPTRVPVQPRFVEKVQTPFSEDDAWPALGQRPPPAPLDTVPFPNSPGSWKVGGDIGGTIGRGKINLGGPRKPSRSGDGQHQRHASRERKHLWSVLFQRKFEQHFLRQVQLFRETLRN